MLKKRYFKIVIVVVIVIIVTILWYRHSVGKSDQAVNVDQSQYIPTLYIHGWGAGARSTNSMIDYAEKNYNADQVLTVIVSKKGDVKFQGKWTKKINRPIIQIVLQDNKNGNYNVTQKWFKNILTKLQSTYHIKKFNTVSHSMGNLITMYYQMNHGSNDKLPKLEKQVNLAGHFDGIIGLDDKVNRNYFLKTGAPRYQNDSFRDLYQHHNNYPKKQVDILNIYGNLDDGTNSDGRVSNVSSRSLKYILQDRYHSYREIEIHGVMGQHSKLHENNNVNRLVGKFLWQ